MKAVADYSSADLTRFTWAVFWRYALIGGIVVYAASILVGIVVGFLWTMIALLLGLSRDFASDVLPWLSGTIGFLVGLLASFWILRWILAGRIGKAVGASKFFIVAMSNDKDSSNAN